MALSPSVLDAIKELGFTQVSTSSLIFSDTPKMTHIQAVCIPLFLDYKDVAAEAVLFLRCHLFTPQVTGSGKTLAFVVPIMEMLLRNPCRTKQHIGALVISPTRELATQIFDIVKVFTAKAPGHANPILLTGGTETEIDVKQMKENGCNIIVATPGRLWDLFRYRFHFTHAHDQGASRR